MTMTLSGDGTITGLVAGGLPDATVTADDLAAGAALNNAPNSVGFRNRIINGDMRIAQRGTSATITAGSTIAAGYSTVDRFYVYCTGANVTAAQVAGSGSNQNRFQITGAASVTAVGVGQRIEQFNSYDLSGQVATLSVDLANSLLTTVTWTAYYATTANTFGTLASPTRTQIATGTFTVTSTVTRYTTNITIPSAATTGIEIVLTVGAQTSGTWTIGNMQLEAGSVATPFERRPYGTELVLCQRYFQKMPQWQWYIYNLSGAGTQGSMTLPVVMRATPTVVQGTYTNSQGASAMSVFVNDATAFRCYATATITNTIVWSYDSSDGSFSAEL
jgi:hypothetical protein